MKEDYLTDELPASVLDTLHHHGAEGRDNPCQEVGLRKDIGVRQGLLRQGREKKITLNFTLARENEADASVIAEYFPKEYFLIKITPPNPTVSTLKNNLTNDVNLETGLPMKYRKFVDNLRRIGYDVIISIGDTRENLIGSNCGQYILRFLKERPSLGSLHLHEGF